MKTLLRILQFVCCAAAFTPFICDAQEKIIIINEGMWQSDNGRLSYFEEGAVHSNQWFRDANGYKLGDTPCDIVQISDNLLAVAVNWSNIIYFITTEGKVVGATEEIPNVRRLACDGRYLYATSYAHTVSINGNEHNFTKGFVAKIDVSTRRVVSAAETGYEPEAIAIYDDCLFVANTGGYAFQEEHDYETTVSVFRTDDLSALRTVDTGRINLYGNMAQSGKYLCISSPGDYYSEDASTVILDCRRTLDGAPDSDCCVSLAVASTANCTAASGNFYAIGSHYSYYTGEYTFDYSVIDPSKVFATHGEDGVDDVLPGTMRSDIASMAMPYSLYVNPYTGYIYATDAGSYASAGVLYQWNPEGTLLGTYKVYINPSRMIALPPNGRFESLAEIESDSLLPNVHYIFNLQGVRVNKMFPGQIYISNGKKYLNN